MDRGAEVDGKRTPELLHDFGLEGSDPAPQRHDIGEERAPAQVDRDPGQRFVERRVSRSETRDAVAVTQRLRQRLAQHDARILDQDVAVDLNVTGAAEPEVEAAV